MNEFEHVLDDDEEFNWVLVGQRDVEHNHSSTQVNLADDIVDKIHHYSMKIPEEDLYIEEDDDSYGREQEPHITVRYGMDTVDPEDLTEAFRDFGPVMFKLGLVSIFETKEYDVIKIDVQSEDLHELNRRVGEVVELPGETYPDYKPHVTVAYVKSGLGKDYKGSDEFEETKDWVTSVILMTRNGKKYEMSLGESNERIKGHE